jgi:hypothetical protein
VVLNSPRESTYPLNSNEFPEDNMNSKGNNDIDGIISPLSDNEDLQLSVDNYLQHFLNIYPMVFDLNPQDSLDVTFSCVGRDGLSFTTTAILDVEGGPSYDVAINGNSSLMVCISICISIIIIFMYNKKT